MADIAVPTSSVTRLLHKAAIKLSQHALKTRRNGFPAIARAEFFLAFRVERDLAASLSATADPAAAVVQRSAAILAFHAGATKEAVKLADASLKNWMPEEVAMTLREIIRRGELAEGAGATDAFLGAQPSQKIVAC